MNEELYWKDHINLVATKNIENDMNYGKGDVAANTSEAIYENDLSSQATTHYNARKYFTDRSLESFIQRDYRIQVLVVNWNVKYKKG